MSPAAARPVRPSPAVRVSDLDPLRPARGLVVGLMLGAVCWIAIVVGLLLLLR